MTAGRVTASAPAERDIELVMSFLNTLDVEDGVDVLAERGGWSSWVRDRDLGAPGAAEQAARVRSALRGSVGDHLARPSGPTGLSTTGELTVHIREHGPVLVAHTAIGEILAAASRLSTLGMWDRVKICPADSCRWAFYDRSRNRSRTWCSMQVCGNREKARIWREKHA
ncbi:CGNR zinc finger domain-containing protein [Sciscionella sediminilitoris]|uniref:CGNR zinc finger domain-containing protein n=1 Tax=Sciscionella sediminilitoris TaxID=1445613 RepID=UPI0004DED12A|nr:CGNR zinc finger domain-containing protein [Sciscionella sp. SE31]